jgi:hypothetical protein
MKQISTGTGLCVLGLGVAVLGAAQLVGSKGGQAFAQTGSERRIVSASVFLGGEYQNRFSQKWGYRIWSDNVIEMKVLSVGYVITEFDQAIYVDQQINASSPFKNWTQVDNGLTAFVSADVDANGTVDSGDIGGVLLDMGNTQNGNPPPPIDCTINAPR